MGLRETYKYSYLGIQVSNGIQLKNERAKLKKDTLGD
jgi:hypothetical protein